MTVVYVVLAPIVGEGGLAQGFANGAGSLLGRNAEVMSHFLAVMSGFLTGINTASNGMMMPVQVALAQMAGSVVGWFAALQNVDPIIDGKAIEIVLPALPIH